MAAPKGSGKDANKDFAGLKKVKIDEQLAGRASVAGTKAVGLSKKNSV